LIALAATSIGFPAETPESKTNVAANREAATLGLGRELYTTHCSNCHGDSGDGLGSAAYLVNPKPRDFRSGVYRLRSTAGGQLPTDEDIARSIRNGLPGTPMAAYGRLLSEEEIAALVAYVKSFSPRFADSVEERTVITIPPAPELTSESAKRGREVYVQLGCIQCHGATGKGDGPSGHLMVDERGYPIPPKDFAGGIFKSGNRPEDLYRTIVTGLNGTAMPAYGATLRPDGGIVQSEDAGWDLIAYLHGLGSDERRRYSEGAGATIRARAVAEEEFPSSPLDAAWEGIDGVEVTLRPLWSRNDFPSRVSVRAIRDARRVAILLEWQDATHNISSIGPADFPDKASIAFPLGSGLPFIGMGSRSPESTPGKQSLVNIWCWRADVDAERKAGTSGDIGSRYPVGYTDFYPFKSGWRPGSGDYMANDQTAEHNPTFITGWGAGNPVSDPAVPEGEITEFDAAGFGTLTAQPAREQHVRGNGAWRVGRWRALFLRDLYTGGDGDAILADRERVPVSFALWDGNYMDRDGIKSVSNWHWLVFENTREERP